MAYVLVTKHLKIVQKTVTPLVSVMMVLFLIALMTIAVQNHGLVMDLKIAKIRRMAAT